MPQEVKVEEWVFQGEISQGGSVYELISKILFDSIWEDCQES
jgi:hypothetical protein